MDSRHLLMPLLVEASLEIGSMILPSGREDNDFYILKLIYGRIIDSWKWAKRLLWGKEEFFIRARATDGNRYGD
jgi:hypothetical protein